MEQLLHKKCKDLSILFIEDYIPLQKKIASILNDYFDYVHIASNGKEGLEKYEKFHQENEKYFDIVMTDYEMPKLNGIELIKAIQKQKNNQTFIVISAHQNPEYLIEFINLRIFHFIPKPIAPENMLEVLNKVSDKHILGNNNLLYINASLVWNKKNKCLLYNNEILDLAKYDLLLLEILLDDFGLICSTEKILSHFYLHNEDVKPENLRNMLARLRKKIPNINIQSIYGIGYKLKPTKESDC